MSGGGGSKQTTTTNSTQTETPYQQGYYDQLLKGASEWLNSGGFDKTYAGGMDVVADMSEAQKAGLGGSINMGQTLGNLFGGAGVSALGDYLGAYDPNRTGLNAAIQAANDQSNFNFETQVNPQIRQGAQGAGQYGGSRHGIAEGLARGQLAASQQQNAAQMAYADQQAFNQNRLGILNNLGNIATGLNAGNTLQYDAGQLQQQQEQNEIQGALNKWAYENNVSLQDLQAFQGLISGNMGGTTTGKSTSVTKGSGGGGSPLGAIGAIGGAALGSMMGPIGTAIGSQLGSMVGNKLGGGGGGQTSTPMTK